MPENDAGQVKQRKSILTVVQKERFDRFWMIYPKRASVGEAEKAWKSLDPDEELTERIIASIMVENRYHRAKKMAGEKIYIKNAATWIRAQCWEDELDDTFSNLAEKAKQFDQRCVHCEQEVTEGNASKYEFGWVCDPCWWRHMSGGDWRIRACRKASVRLGITKNTTLEDLRKMAKEEGKKARGRMTTCSNEDARSESLRRASKRD